MKKKVERMRLAAISTCEGGDTLHNGSQQMERTPTAIDGLIPGEHARGGKSASYASVIALKQEPVGRRRGCGRIIFRYHAEVVKEKGAVRNKKATRSCTMHGALDKGAWSHGGGSDVNDTAWSWIIRDIYQIHEQPMLSS